MCLYPVLVVSRRGVLLFLLYTIRINLAMLVILYADDASLQVSHKDNVELEETLRWLSDKHSLHVGKTEAILRLTNSVETLIWFSDSVACRHSVVGRGKLDCQTRTANQLLSMSLVAEKCSIEQPIRTETTESASNWANRTKAIGFLPVLKTEAWWENTEISPQSQTTSLTNSCLWVLWHFFENRTQKSYWCLTQSYQLQL